MADQNEPKARYPRQEVAEGQKHGYIGDVEVYDPVGVGEPGYSNVKTERTEKTAADSVPPEEIGAQPKGVVGKTKTDDSKG